MDDIEYTNEEINEIGNYVYQVSHPAQQVLMKLFGFIIADA